MIQLNIFVLLHSFCSEACPKASDDVKYKWCCVQIQQVLVDVVFVHESQSLGGGVAQRMKPPYGSIETEKKASVVDPHWVNADPAPDPQYYVNAVPDPGV